MHRNKKGNRWHFGKETQIGVDADSGMVHTVRGTAGNVDDVVEGNSLLQGHEELAFGAANYKRVNERADAKAHMRLHVAMRAVLRRGLEPST